MDYEQVKFYRLIVRAQDTGSPPKANVTNVLINLIDVNDNSPVFYSSLMQETVPENTKENEKVIYFIFLNLTRFLNNFIVRSKRSQIFKNRHLKLAKESDFNQFKKFRAKLRSLINYKFKKSNQI